MSQNDTAVLFAGQGKLAATAFRCSEKVKPDFADICRQIDEVSFERSRIRISDLDTAEANTASLSSGTLQLAIFGASVAAYRALVRISGTPSVLLGQGMGEITALVCGGSLSVAQGARIICERHELLKQIDPTIGCMAVLDTDGLRAADLIDNLQSDLVSIAAENSPVETVIAGATPQMRQTAKLAAKHDIGYRSLASRYALHSWALMRETGEALRTAVSDMPAFAPKVPVYSSWLGRCYRTDDAIPSLLATYVARPFRFADAIRQLYGSGVSTYIECGPLAGVNRHVENTIRRYTASMKARVEQTTAPEDKPSLLASAFSGFARAADACAVFRLVTVN